MKAAVQEYPKAQVRIFHYVVPGNVYLSTCIENAVWLCRENICLMTV
jgi:hypothetical protein